MSRGILTVVAVGDDPVPMEGLVGWIGKEPVQVPNSFYYRRQITDGSLAEAPETTPAGSSSPAPAPTAPTTTTARRGRDQAASAPDTDPTMSTGTEETVK